MYSLTKTESELAWLIATGGTRETICLKMNIEPSTFRVHVRNIRNKSGLATLDPEKLGDYLRGNGAPGQQLLVSDAQKDVLRLYIKGLGHSEIARELGICKGTSMNHLSTACIALGIASREKGRRKALLRQAIVTMDAGASLMEDPMF